MKRKKRLSDRFFWWMSFFKRLMIFFKQLKLLLKERRVSSGRLKAACKIKKQQIRLKKLLKPFRLKIFLKSFLKAA